MLSRRQGSIGLVVAAVLCACGAGASGRGVGGETPRPAQAPSSFAAVYREATNAFEILDNASAWLPEKNEAEYRDYWKTRFGLTADEEARFAAWAEVRKRAWSPEPEGSTVLLGRTKPPDRLAAIFHRETDLATAIARAGELLGPVDGATVRATFEAFSAKLDVLLAESRAFEAIAPKLQARLDDPKATAYVARLARFYGSGDLARFTVAFVWWPPIEGTSASLAGDVLLLRYHPVKHRDVAERNVDVPIHEVVHFASLHQPEAQKTSLSTAFAAKCSPSPKLPPVRLLEEPLAVAHQKMFLADFEPATFDRARAWYGDPWVSAMAKLLYDPLVRAHADGRVLDDRLAADAGRSCRELMAVVKELAR